MAVAVAHNSVPVPNQGKDLSTSSVLHLVPKPETTVYSEEKFFSIVNREAAFLTTPEGAGTIDLHIGRVAFLFEQLSSYDNVPDQQIDVTADQLRLHTSILEAAGVEIPADIFE